MTAAVNMESLIVEDIPDDVPNHRATSSGERGEPIAATRSDKGSTRPGIFGRSRTATSGPTKQKKAKDVPPRLPASAKETLEQIYAGLGGMITPFDEVCGTAIIDAAPMCAETVYRLAQQNDAVRRFIISLTQTSITGAVLIAHMPIIMAIAAHHSKSPTVKMVAMGGLFATKAQAATLIEDLDKQERENAENV